MFDIIILLALAIFFFTRLRNVLGKNVDDEVSRDTRPQQIPLEEAARRAAEKHAAEVEEEKVEAEEAAIISEIDNENVTKGLASIKAMEQGFSVKQFLSGAQMAFEMIVNAYHKGDKATLKPLLAKDVYEDFEAVMDEHARTEEIEENTLVSIQSADITKATLKGKKAQITVQFVSEQIAVVRDKNGKVIEGDPSVSELVTDEWVFERTLNSSTPNWMLVAT